MISLNNCFHFFECSVELTRRKEARMNFSSAIEIPFLARPKLIFNRKPPKVTRLKFIWPKIKLGTNVNAPFSIKFHVISVKTIRQKTIVFSCVFETIVPRLSIVS